MSNIFHKFNTTISIHMKWQTLIMYSHPLRRHLHPDITFRKLYWYGLYRFMWCVLSLYIIFATRTFIKSLAHLRYLLCWRWSISAAAGIRLIRIICGRKHAELPATNFISDVMIIFHCWNVFSHNHIWFILILTRKPFVLQEIATPSDKPVCAPPARTYWLLELTEDNLAQNIKLHPEEQCRKSPENKAAWWNNDTIYLNQIYNYPIATYCNDNTSSVVWNYIYIHGRRRYKWVLSIYMLHKPFICCFILSIFHLLPKQQYAFWLILLWLYLIQRNYVP